MKSLGRAVCVLVATATALAAQDKQTLEMRPFAGALMPTGHQRDLYKDSPLAGMQLAAELKPGLHILGTFVWTAAEDRLSFSDQGVDIFEFNVGVEIGTSEALSASWVFKPFVGVGGGARTYRYAEPDITDRTCGEVYGSAGAEFQIANTAFRFEARDNVFCYRSPFNVTQQDRRNDVAVTAGVAYHFR